jgi:pimeloyl-ACP methyl ester carboxylesterase
VTSVLLGVASAFMSALALGATALIVPGTGTPNANIVADYREHARDYYMQGTACTDNANCAVNNTGDPAAGGLLGIDYPASFWPVPFHNWCPGLTCDTWNVSVGQGVTNLDTALRATTGDDSVVIFGYSQGGAVVATELAKLARDPAQLAKINKVVTIGGILNPDGGLWSRLSFIPYVPILNITPRPAMPVGIPELAGKVYTVGMQYDPVVYSPQYWGNPVAVLNAVAALLNVHGYYLADDGSPLAYGYTPTELADQMNCTAHPANCRADKYGNTYVMIPARSLPLADLVMSVMPAPLKPFVKPFVDLATPVLKVVADLGYDWSGDPSVVRPLSILPFNPFQNWVDVGVKLVAATLQGAQAFAADVSGVPPTVTPVTPVAPAPQPNTPEPRMLSKVSTVSERDETKPLTAQSDLVDDKTSVEADKTPDPAGPSVDTVDHVDTTTPADAGEHQPPAGSGEESTEAAAVTAPQKTGPAARTSWPNRRSTKSGNLFKPGDAVAHSGSTADKPHADATKPSNTTTTTPPSNAATSSTDETTSDATTATTDRSSDQTAPAHDTKAAKPAAA